MPMDRTEDGREKRLAELRRQVPTRGLERHPSVLAQISDLPAELRSPAVDSLAASESIQTLIAFPPQIHRGWHYVPRQALLFGRWNVVHVQASIWPDEECQVTCVQGSGIMVMRVTLLLLYGCLEIVAQGHTTPARLGMEFNTVAWAQLSRPLRQLLQASRATPGEPAGATAIAPAARQVLDDLPLKFFNGVKIYGLLPGEELQDLVFQPGTWGRHQLVFRHPVTANTLLLLTTNYVVVIEERLRVAQGWIFSYVPRSSIDGMQNRLRGPWNHLTVRLRRGDQTSEHELLLTNGAVQAWRLLWTRQGGRWQDLGDEA